METNAVGFFVGATIILIVVVLNGCEQFSIIEKSSSAGFNGSFEIEKSQLPVNWRLHYPPIKNGDAKISLDTTDAVEGNQSLKFMVHRVDGPGWRSAGLFQARPARENRSYKVSFWLKNQGSKVSVLIRSNKPKTSPPASRKVLGEQETGVNTWRRFEYVYTIPETYDNIRLDLNIVQPGTVWIDDVRIEEVQTD